MSRFDISIVVNCYNKEPFLKECIDSVLQQTWKPKEIVLIHDDCQQPQSYTYCRTIILPENVGISKARDIGVKNTDGYFIMFLDGDDKIAPDYIEKGIRANADIVYSDVLTWFEYEGTKSQKDNKLYKPPSRMTVAKMWKHCQILVSSIMTRKVYDDIGGFRNFPIFEDWDFWLRCMARGYKFKKFNSLFYYRQSQNTRNQKPKDYRRKIADKIKAGFIKEKNKLKEIKFINQLPS
jgi:teichuronic acid biosynthesis glycosyltransferase TuaG